MNALYDAPRNADGTRAQRRARSPPPIALGADETVHLRYGCDGQTLAIAVADPFGSLSSKAVTDRLRKVRDGIPKPDAGVAGAGLGLVMTYSVANQLIFAVSPGRLTEVTAVLHVGGTNRAAQERGTAVHFYVGEQQAWRVVMVPDRQTQIADGSLHVTIAGKIDEKFDGAPCSTAPTARSVMHLGGVRSISSLGVRAFEMFVQRAPAEVVLVHVSPAIASQLTMIPNLRRQRTTVESAKLPFICPALRRPRRAIRFRSRQRQRRPRAQVRLRGAHGARRPARALPADVIASPPCASTQRRRNASSTPIARGSWPPSVTISACA